MLKVLVADDHYLIRDGLVKALGGLTTDLCVSEADSGSALLSLVSQDLNYDIILLDLFMPGTNGFDLLVRLGDDYPDIPVIILSASEDAQHMRKALDCGAAGFIPKSTPPSVMLNAIQLVLSGGVYLPPNLLRPNQEDPASSILTSDDIESKNSTSDQLCMLTERQREVLLLLSEGQQNKLIARQLGLSEHTVKVHVRAVFRTLGVSNRTQAVLAAQALLSKTTT